MSDREKIARIVDPNAFPDESDNEYCWCTHLRYNLETEQQIALDTADKILAAVKGRAEIIEECARIAEFFNDGAHIAHDMQTGIFPKRSATRDAIADKIRDLALSTSHSEIP